MNEIQGALVVFATSSSMFGIWRCVFILSEIRSHLKVLAQIAPTPRATP